MKGRMICKKELRSYLIGYLFYYLLIIILFAGPEILILLLSLYVKNVEARRLAELINFLRIVRNYGPIVVLYPISRRLSRLFDTGKELPFCQGVIVGAIVGIIVGLSWSIVHFVITSLQGRVIDAIIDFISFLWRSWGYMLEFAIVMILFVTFNIVITHFDEIKGYFTKIKEEGNDKG